MCFSPTASFVTAGLTGTLGIIALTRANGPREWPLASVPMVFAIQQGIEGLLWLDLPSGPTGSTAIGLPLLFLLFAEVFWPVYAPITILLVEPSAARRHLKLLCLAVGLGASSYLLWRILAGPHGAILVEGHIVYYTGGRLSNAVGVAYLAATGVSGMLSSRRTLAALGTVILMGSAAAYVLYWEAFVSVWCFFAAVASVMILWHIEWSRWQRLRIARAFRDV